MYICGYVLCLCEIDEEWGCSCWIADDFMIICCCCLGCFVDELMHWVFIIVNWWWKLLLLLKVWWSWLNCWILMKWCFNFKFFVSLSAFLCIRPVNIFWDEFGAFERSKFGILGEKGLKPETFWQSWWVLAWASMQASKPSRFWT